MHEMRDLLTSLLHRELNLLLLTLIYGQLAKGLRLPQVFRKNTAKLEIVVLNSLVRRTHNYGYSFEDVLELRHFLRLIDEFQKLIEMFFYELLVLSANGLKGLGCLFDSALVIGAEAHVDEAEKLGDQARRCDQLGAPIGNYPQYGSNNERALGDFIVLTH